MKLKALVAAAFLTLSFGMGQMAGAADAPAQVKASADAQECQQLRDSGASAEVLAQRGCCSWHQGVCGCEQGRVTCCDGTFSPTCRCNKDDPPASL